MAPSDESEPLPPATGSHPSRSWVRGTLRFLRSHPAASFGLVVIAAYIAVAVLASEIAPFEYQKQGVGGLLEPPSAEHWLGTDEFGRDMFSRVVVGSRISLRVAVVVVAVAGVGGTLIGLFSGYRGGWVDEVVMRVTDVFLAVPGLVLAIAITTALGPSILNAIIGIAAVRWTHYARLMRASVLVEKQKEYVLAAQAMGARPARIMFRYVLPNGFASVLVQGTLDFGWAILVAAGLSFVGAGAQPPSPEWGALVASGRSLVANAWWVPTFPGLAILGIVFASNLLGDALRDVSDPRLRHEATQV